jgi:hypothetical protein
MQGYWSQGKWFRTTGDPTIAEAIVLATCWSPVSGCALIPGNAQIFSTTNHHKMFDIVAADEDDASFPVDRQGFDYCYPR